MAVINICVCGYLFLTEGNAVSQSLYIKILSKLFIYELDLSLLSLSPSLHLPPPLPLQICSRWPRLLAPVGPEAPSSLTRTVVLTAWGPGHAAGPGLWGLWGRPAVTAQTKGCPHPTAHQPTHPTHLPNSHPSLTTECGQCIPITV